MRAIRRRRAAVAVGLAAALFAVVLSAAASSKEGRDGPDWQGTQEIAIEERDSQAIPSTGVGEGHDDLRFVHSTDSGGAVFECLGTVSHAHLDNNFARLMEEARRRCGTDTASGS